jgi:4'-phosphopantetheinyl transferase EntD
MLPDKRFLQSTLGEPLGLELQFSVADGAASATTLSPSEQRRFHALRNTARATSWLLGRTALKKLSSKVDGCADIDGLLFPNPRFSLTHSSDLALAVAEPSGCLEGIGVDLEVGTRMQASAGRFFLTERESSWLGSQATGGWSHHLLRLWCIKEAVFKANPDNAGRILADHEIRYPALAQGMARSCSGRTLEYTSWCESRTCVALAVCR